MSWRTNFFSVSRFFFKWCGKREVTFAQEHFSRQNFLCQYIIHLWSLESPYQGFFPIYICCFPLVNGFFFYDRYRYLRQQSVLHFSHPLKTLKNHLSHRMVFGEIIETCNRPSLKNNNNNTFECGPIAVYFIVTDVKYKTSQCKRSAIFFSKKNALGQR